MTSLEEKIFHYDPNPYTFFGYMGIAAALIGGNLGAAYGTAKSGVSICFVASRRMDLLFKSIIPVIMAGILGIYGLIVSVLFNGDIKKTSEQQITDGDLQYDMYKGYK